MATDCKIRLLSDDVREKVFGGKQVPEELVRRLVDDIEAIKANSDPKTFKSRVGDYLNTQRELTQVEKQIRTLNLRLAKQRLEFYRQPAFDTDPVEALKSKMTFSKYLANGGKDSAEFRIQAINYDYKNYLVTGLEKSGLRELFYSGQIDKEIYIEVEALSLNRNVGATKNAQAIEIAKIIHGYNRKVFRDLRESGVAVRDMPGYVTKQTHNIEAIREAGFESWAAEVAPKLDLEKTFGVKAGDQAAMRKGLESMYKSIVAGRFGEQAPLAEGVEDILKSTGYTTSMADRLAEARFLRFKDAASAFEYNSRFGNGNLAENTFSGVDRTSRLLGLVQIFGTNPRASIQADMDRLFSSLKKAGKDDLAKLIKPSSDKYNPEIMNLFDEVSGVTSMPGHNMKARIGRNIRMVQELSKLAFAGARSLTNFATAATQLKTSTGQGFLEAQYGVIKEWLNSLPKENRNLYARKAGLFVQDMQHEIMRAAGADHFADGKAARMVTLFHKMTGLETMTSAIKTAFGNMIMEEMAENVGKNFDGIEPRLKATLLQAGIDGNDFEILKRAVEDMPDGRKFLTSEAIASIEADAGVKAAAANRKVSPSKYLRELQLKYSAFIIQGADIASTSAGSRERAIIKGGTMAGTTWGETRRLLGQFKGFAFQAHYIANQILNSAPQEQMLTRGVVMSKGMVGDTLGQRLGKKDYTSFAQFAMAATAFAYLGDSLVQIAQGKNPKDPTKPETWVDAAAKSGVGGLYTDFFLGEYARYSSSFAEGLLGPTFGQIAGVGQEVVQKSLRSQLTQKGSVEKLLASEGTRMIRNNLPLQQVPLIKQGLDYMQFDVIQETLTPGYKARSELLKRRRDRREGVRF